MKRIRFVLCLALLLPTAGPVGCGGDDSSSDADVGESSDNAETLDDAPADEARDDAEADVPEGGDVEPDGDVEPEADGEAGELTFCGENPDGTPCDDGNACTTGEACAGGACTGGTVNTCDDGEPCTDDVCDPATGGCSNTNNTAICDDGDACTINDVCAGGSCVSGTPLDCSSLADGCNAGACDALTGACVAIPFSDGVLCDDGDACTLGDACTAGVCGSTTLVDCTWLDDDCNTGACQSADGSCAAVPRADGISCDDGAACTTADACRAGSCIGRKPDADGDGYFAAGCLDGDDCDDGLWDVNPGAVEGPVGRATCFDHLDNNCDGRSDLADAGCAGLDFAILDSPTTMTANAGATTPLVRGRVYEPGLTEPVGPAAGLTAELGWGAYRTDPTDNPGWTWVPADYLGQGGPGGAHDVYAAQFTAPPAGQYSYAYRFSTDGGATWLYADTDGNGAAPPSNGIQVDRLGTLDVVINDHLLLSEVCVVSTGRELVELYNPTASAVDLSTYYLTDSGDSMTTWRYWDIVVGSGTLRPWDFVIRFPAGATIAPRTHVVVSMGSAQTFHVSFGINPNFEMCPDTTDEPTVQNMVQAWAGAACGATGPLNNITETLILFRWNGATDLVQDVDIFQWGDTTEAVLKTGVSRDGPDAGTTTSTYLADTPIASQSAFLPTPHDLSNSFQRIDMGETGERTTGGNGITGHDETSEPWATTWAISAAATPGT